MSPADLYSIIAAAAMAMAVWLAVFRPLLDKQKSDLERLTLQQRRDRYRAYGA